jgi:hypothetical protein
MTSSPAGWGRTGRGVQGGCPAYVVMPHCNRAAKSDPDRRCRKKLRCFAAGGARHRNRVSSLP